MNKYLISLIGTIFFSITTAILFALSWMGVLYILAGSVAMGVTIYFVNVALLLFFLIFYAWQKAKKRPVSVGTYETLSAYANTQRDASTDLKIPKVVKCDVDELQRVILQKGEQIVTVTSGVSDIIIGQEILLTSKQHQALIIRAKVIGLNDVSLRVFMLSVETRVA